MRIDILTILPELLLSPLSHSIIKRAQTKGLVEICLHDIRRFSADKHKKVDDYPFGGGAGMVMTAPPIFAAIQWLKAQRAYDAVIFTTPDGQKYNQMLANELSLLNSVIILCGHYKGIDHRVREHLVSHEVSIGDYVLTGGELAAAVIVDSIVRLIPGAISDGESALLDSFQDGMLAPPVYTRPEVFNGWRVPSILLSGHAQKIREWQQQQALERTQLLRPDLLHAPDSNTSSNKSTQKT
jgi:tRNA (guanine37-N1)-methyltransferase